MGVGARGTGRRVRGGPMSSTVSTATPTKADRVGWVADVAIAVTPTHAAVIHASMGFETPRS